MSSTLPPEKIEPLIFKLAVTNTKYTALLLDHFESSWFEDKHLGDLLGVTLRFFTKYEGLPSLPTMDLIISKKYNAESYKDISIRVKNVWDIDISGYDLNYLDEQIVNYLRNAGLYHTIMTDIEKIESSHSVEHCLDKLQRISAMNFSHDIGFQYFEELDEHMAELANPEAKLSTGWDNLDNTLGGGLLKEGKCLVTFMGESHIGKSLFLSNLASNLLNMNKFVIIISLEMSEQVYGTRIDAHLSNSDINQIQYNVDEVKDTISHVKAKNSDAKLIIKEYAPDSLSCNQIKNYLDKVISTLNRTPDVIIVDYINLLIPNGGGGNGENSYTKIGNVVKQMRALSYTYKRPFVSVTQCNREAYSSTNIGMDKISESMGIAHTSDCVFSIWQNEGDKENNVIRTSTLKNRLGGQIGKTLNFHIDYESLKISDMNTTFDAKSSGITDIMSEIDNELENIK